MGAGGGGSVGYSSISTQNKTENRCQFLILVSFSSCIMPKHVFSFFAVFHCVKNEKNKHTALYTVDIKTKSPTIIIFKIQN